jgi:hypothetical protein
MGSLSKSNIYDAGKRPAPEKPRAVMFNGERRSEKWPSGTFERFVDLQGNVVSEQLCSPGVVSSPDTINRKRHQLHTAKSADGTVQGYVEHSKCPLRHGINMLTPSLEQEFAEMPMEIKAPCKSDPVIATRAGKSAPIEYKTGCPHIEWLIASRREREALRRAQRASKAESIIEIEKKKLEAIERQADAAVKANEKLVAFAESNQRGRKAPTE